MVINERGQNVMDSYICPLKVNPETIFSPVGLWTDCTMINWMLRYYLIFESQRVGFCRITGTLFELRI